MSARTISILLAVLLFFALVAGIIFAFKNFSLRGDLGIRNGQLRRANRDLQHSRDSTQAADARYEVLKMSMAHKVIELRDSLKAEKKNTTKWKDNYVKAKNYRVPADISDAGLDSLVSRFLEGQH